MNATVRARRSKEADFYFQYTSSVASLSADEERKLAERVAIGDAEARDQLTRANLRLVVRLAKAYMRRGVSYEDLVAEGNLGLLRAVEAFDSGKGVRFEVYATHWIKQSLRAATLKQGKFVRLPHHAVTTLAKWRRTAAHLAKCLNRTPTDAEIGNALKLGVTKMRRMRQVILVAGLTIHGSDAGAQDKGHETSLLDEVTDSREIPAEDRLSQTELQDQVLRRLGGLDARSAVIVKKRFGLYGEESQSLHEIALEFGLTRERIRQLEANAIRSLAV